MAYINGKHTTVNVNVYGEIPETASGTVIYAVSMGLSRDCVVGTDYAVWLEDFVFPENIKAGDYMIDGDSACWFQFLDLEDDGASLGGCTNRVVCVANPNGKAEGTMVFKGEVNNYTELPTEATEGDIYFCSNYYSDFDINSIIFNDITQGIKGSLDYVKEGCIKGEAGGNFISYFESTINGFSMPQNIGEKNDYLFNDEYVCFIRRANSDLNGKYYYNALQVYKYSVSCIDDYEGGTDIIRSMYYTDVYNAEYLRNADVEYLNAKITQSVAWDWAVIPKSQINEYPKGAYIYSLGKWVHM